ncbi:MAG: class I SAM-dependent methyltransferase [Sideroxydans sp.]|nr:class I SAM-dependent methyltransferase [Sideroxydans sp.]
MPTADHFTAVASQYAAFRPDYPAELFDWLTSLVPQRLQAWDCGAGSGQATVQLASRFEQVLATDISSAQLAAAPAMPNVTARVAPAEDCGLPDYSLDLVTVAQAMHWFDLDTFYAEVRRVLRPRGVIAVWGYNRLSLPQPEVQRRLDDFYEGSIGPYWPAERIHVENSYRDLSFPFTRIEPLPLPCASSGRATSCSAICAAGRLSPASDPRTVSIRSILSPPTSRPIGRRKSS